MDNLENRVLLFSGVDIILQKMFTDRGAIVIHDPSAKWEVAVFTPGPDVSPFLYGETKMLKTITSPLRDMRENRLYRKLPAKAPKIGIGRGAHFLNVMNGGKVIQDVSGHLNNHELLDTFSGDTLIVTSAHRQEMVPTDDAAILAIANVADIKDTPLGREHIDLRSNDAKKIHEDHEVVFYDRTASLCFQPRPEFPHKMTTDYFYRLVSDWIEPICTKMYTIPGKAA